jgi:eukaryotic-like serine/threonine-protein kinase
LREGTLMAQPLDFRRLEMTGDAVPIAEQVGNYLSIGQFSASRTGALVFRSGGGGSGARLTWLDRQGNTVGMPTDAAYDNVTLTLSPDGSRAAAQLGSSGPTSGGRGNIWLVDLVRGGRTRFTYTQNGSDAYAAWSPDGTRIAFSSSRGGHFDLYQYAANGAGEDEPLLKSDTDKYVKDWSRDGRFLLFDQANSENRRDLWVLPMDGAGERKPIPFLRTEFSQRTARFSPDGRWIAYQSTESGQSEIYVRPFPPPAGGGGKWMISQGGGLEPRWRRDGKELFFVATDGQLMASEVAFSNTAFQATTPKALFKAQTVQGWDVSADGTKFLFPITRGETAPVPFTVVLNWTALLNR